MLGILIFIIIFGVIVVVYEFGYFYFVKKLGIFVCEFVIGMGLKIFFYIDKEGIIYIICILLLGGYVCMVGWGDDKIEIKIGMLVSFILNKEGIVICINLLGK